MVLDSVLEEQSYNKDNMIDMFIEGYLAACEVIDNNIKFTNVEEMTEVLEEVALQSIEELSKECASKASKTARKDIADMAEKDPKQPLIDNEKAMKRMEQANKFARYAIKKKC